MLSSYTFCSIFVTRRFSQKFLRRIGGTSYSRPPVHKVNRMKPTIIETVIANHHEQKERSKNI